MVFFQKREYFDQNGYFRGIQQILMFQNINIKPKFLTKKVFMINYVFDLCFKIKNLVITVSCQLVLFFRSVNVLNWKYNCE